jgi:ABC-type dipeptide/oligopeptide/nickel transport system ATPase component
MVFEVVIGRSKKSIEKHGRKGTVFIGKQYVKMGEVTSLSNPVYLDVASSHVVFVVGKRGGGKSYTMGVIAEGIADLEPEVKQNLAVVLLDTMGVFWTMKYPNMQDTELLKEWKMEPKPLDVKIYTPAGFYYKFKKEGIPTDFPFSIRPIDVDPEDWCRSFGLDINSAEGVLLTKVVQDLIKSKESFEINEIIKNIGEDKESDKVTKSVILNQLEKANGWGIFSKKGTPLKELVRGGQITVLDVSPYATMPSGWAIKALVVGLIAKELFNQRMIARKTEEFSKIDTAMHYFAKETEEKLEEPLVWLVIDEAHELLPKEGKTAATEALITILREGRQPGISLILASQQPGKIHTDVMTQSDTVISHRLTAKMDVDALGQLMQSYMRKGLDEELNLLPAVKGSAVIFDDLNEKLFPIQIRPRFTWHGGSAPVAIKERKEFMKKLGEL